MANPIGSVRAEMSAGWAGFKADMGKARRAVQENATGMSRAMDAVKKKFTETAQAINRFGGYAVAGAAVAMVAFVKQQIDVADKMGKLAQQTGTTSEFLSSMGLVASQTGTSLESIAKGTQRLAMNMNDMRRGVGDAKEAFEMLDLSVVRNDGTLKNSETVMKAVADRFAGMEDGADKTALAMRLFGRAGAELIPMLNQGSAGIEDLQKKAKEMGLVISTETALQAAYLNDQLDLLKKSATGAGRSIALSLIPWLNEAFETIKYAKEESGTLMAAWVALGAVGDAVFGKSAQQKINALRRELELLEWEAAAVPDLGIPGQAGRDKRIQAIKDELAALERGQEAQQQRIEQSIKKAEQEAEARRKNTEELILQNEARINADAEAAKAQDAKNKLLQEEADLREELYEWSVAGWIAEDEWRRASIEGAKESIAALKEQRDAIQEIIDEGKNQFEELKRVIDGWGKDSAAAIADFAMRGETSFRDMIDSMINDLLRMMVYQNITKPLFGFVGGLFGSAHGNAFQNGNVIPFAKGGIVSQPTIFPMAQGAGLMGEAGPEAILPLTRIGGDLGVKSTGGGAVVNIYNNVGADVRTEERQTAGGIEIDVLIDQAVAKKLGTFGSQSNKAMRQSFGARQQLTGR
ncbi:MAG: phage tail tape measure C-terminal domain-containing protein [Dehalococcoidales bacterium]|nr:phage tail tape measure C-terminal domain-containing protein [Dehalococcoidales bacterium]